MERIDEIITEFNKRATARKNEPGTENYNWSVEENGTKYVLPYKTIKRVLFSNISQKELIDIPHSARLQYRLMLLEPVIKATVNYVKGTILVIYNNTGSGNQKEKMSRDEIVEFLGTQSVHVDPAAVNERDYDYYSEFFKYTFEPQRVRETAPYGIKMEEWKRIRPEYEAKTEEQFAKKMESFHEWQGEYATEHPDILKEYAAAAAAAPAKKGGLFGGKKKSKASAGGGHWFHGL